MLMINPLGSRIGTVEEPRGMAVKLLRAAVDGALAQKYWTSHFRYLDDIEHAEWRLVYRQLRSELL